MTDLYDQMREMPDRRLADALRVRLHARLDGERMQLDDPIAPAPSSTAGGAIQHRIDEQDITEPADITEPTLEVIMLSPDRNDPPTTSRRWMMVAAAVAALALVGGLIFAGTRADEDPVPADQPEPTVPAVEPDPEVESAPEPDATLSSSVAEQFVVALGDYDTATAIAVVDADAQIQHYGQTGTRAEISLGIAMEDAIGGRTELLGCESTGPDQVTCEATYTNDRIEAVGGVPGEMIYLIRVDNGLIGAYRVALDTNSFGSNPWGAYLDFVFEQSLDDFAAMFASHPDGMGIVGPLLTEKSVELHRQYTEGFILEHGDGS